ncbi:MAG: hypothetical protein AAGD10_04635 [Myxococcota bacterium]
MRMRLGELLMQRGLITAEMLGEALQVQRRRGLRLGTALVRLGRITEQQLVRALSERLQVPLADVQRPDPDALGAVSARFASEHELLPIRLRTERGRRVLTVAMSDPTDVQTIDELGFMANARIEVTLATPNAIDRAIRAEWGTRFGIHTHNHEGPGIHLPDQPTGPMTILRRGGGEDEIDTAARASNRAETGGIEEEAILLTERVVSPQAELEVPSSDRPLGDASGQVVDSESVREMEKRFWALMRLLTRKGVISKEDFLRELGEES